MGQIPQITQTPQINTPDEIAGKLAPDDDDASEADEVVTPDRTSNFTKAYPVEELQAQAVEAAERRRKAAENLPEFIAIQPEAIVRRWKYHAARSMRTGKAGQESAKKLDEMIGTYGPKWGRKQAGGDEASDEERAEQYKGLPSGAYALAHACDLTIGEIVHRDSLGLPLSPVEQLIADVVRDVTKPKPNQAARDRLARINKLVEENP